MSASAPIEYADASHEVRAVYEDIMAVVDSVAALPYADPARMAAAGVPLRTIQHWMGHADAKTTQVYAHYQPSDAEAETIEKAFASY